MKKRFILLSAHAYPGEGGGGRDCVFLILRKNIS